MLTIGEVFISIIATALFVSFYQKRTNAFCKSKKKLNGKTALVTGGTSGMGFEIAKDFAERGARVIIACPFNGEGEHAKEIIIQETGNNKVVFKNLDLGSFKSVRDLAADILNSEDRLDILVNNAGVGGGFPTLKPTEDGLNNIMQINYYGHFLLTLLLLPILKKTPSRIVNMSSSMHGLGKITKECANNNKLLYKIRMYSNSKLYLIYFARELTRQLKGADVTVNCADPGAVGTGIWNAIAGQTIGYIISLFFSSIFKTPLEGAQTAIQMAVDEDLDEISGEFFKNCEKTRAAKKAYIEKDARFVWDQSVRVCKISDSELEQCLK